MFWRIVLNMGSYVLFAVGIFYIWSRWYFNFWKRKGVPGPPPEFLFGNIKDSFLLKKNVNFDFQKLYNQHKALPYTGIYISYKKTLCVHSLDLIKDIFVRDFSHFTDRSYIIKNEKNDPLGMHLVNLTGNEWKVMRHRLTPTFSTAKMKFMFDTMVQCNGDMLAYLDSEVATHGVVDVKELFAKLNTDVIGSCAFGIECNTFKDPNQKFREVGMNFLYPSAFRTFVRAFCLIFPYLSKLLNISFIEKDVHDFMFGLVKSTIKYREDNQVRRNDFLQILLDLKDEESGCSGKSEAPIDAGPRLTTLQIAAQVFVFFIGGFESSSTTQSFALYELALNPAIQAALRAEVDEVLSRHLHFTYEALRGMSYLTKVIEETLRKYPPLPVIFRTCTKDYSLPGDIRLEKGTAVMVPVLAIQRDPDYFPDPDKFDPERFSPENKAARHHFAYLPFGEGPRVCIGTRFAMLQTRLGLASLLSKYEVAVCEKSRVPLEYDTRSFILTSAGGVWLKLTKRTLA